MARRAGPGGAKTETISLRVTPRMKFGLDLLARAYSEPLRDIISRALENEFTSENGGLWFQMENSSRPLLNTVWAERASDRLANLAFSRPDLLTRTEREMWSRIQQEPAYWSSVKARSEEHLLRELLASDFDILDGPVGIR